MSKLESPAGKSPESSDTKPELDTGVRLNVFLQEHGIASRRKADELIEEGKVKVDGKTVKKLGSKISPDAIVSVAGRIIRGNVPKMTYLLNKPDLCLTSRTDDQGRPTIFDIKKLSDLPKNVQAVGRLDYRSEGLLILTNDGDLAYALSHPKFSVEKTYSVLVASPITVEELEKLRTGVMLDDGIAKAVAARSGGRVNLSSQVKGQWVEITVEEGRNRLIRRMMEAIGMKVVRLVRTNIGEISLPMTTKAGQVHSLDDMQLAYLEKIKERMLKQRTKKTDLAKVGLSKENLEMRRAKRKVSMTNLEYTEEITRRSAVSGAKIRERDSRLGLGPLPRIMPTTPVKKSYASSTDSGAKPRFGVYKDTDEKTPVKEFKRKPKPSAAEKPKRAPKTKVESDSTKPKPIRQNKVTQNKKK